MLNNTSEKLASIQSKIETINERLEAGRLYSISSSGSDSISVFERTRSLFRIAMERQSFYAHFFKLLALFCIAVAHLIYLQSFMDAYSVLEDYTFKLHLRYAPPVHPTTTLAPPMNLYEQLSTTPASVSTKDAAMEVETLNDAQLMDLRAMSNQMELLASYRSNNWACVAAMCIALCTSSFFLFILPITEVCKRRELLMGVIDLLSFSAIPFLLITRIFIVESLEQTLATGILGAHKLLSAERVMNVLQCTVYPRERLPFCSDQILSTIFPVILLKYLIILAFLTLLYIALAYLIEWCIRHWFPHKNSSDRQCRRSLRHSCCVCTPTASKTGYNKCPSMSSIRPLRPYQNRSYVPPLIVEGANLKPVLKSANFQQPSQPLLRDNEINEDQHSVAESIPAEPLPSQKV